jgi:hypothetical protein
LKNAEEQIRQQLAAKPTGRKDSKGSPSKLSGFGMRVEQHNSQNFTEIDLSMELAKNHPDRTGGKNDLKIDFKGISRVESKF